MKKIVIDGKLVLDTSEEATTYFISRSFTRSELHTLSYFDMLKKLSKIPRYFKISNDVIEDIRLICEDVVIPDGKNKLDICLSRLEFVLENDSIKKFYLTNKQKQLLFSAFGFLSLHKEQGNILDKDTNKLFVLLGRISSSYNKEIEKQLEYAHRQFAKITEGKDVLVDHLVFSTSMCFAFIETDPNIDVKLLKKIGDLSTKIFNKQDKLYSKTDSFITSMRLVHKFTSKDY